MAKKVLRLGLFNPLADGDEVILVGESFDECERTFLESVVREYYDRPTTTMVLEIYEYDHSHHPETTRPGQPPIGMDGPDDWQDVDEVSGYL
jgi:hypothetical protein